MKFGPRYLCVILLVLVRRSTAADFLDILTGDGFKGVPSKRLVIHRIGQCPGQKNLPIYFPDFKVSQHNKTDYVVNGEVIFREDFPNGWTGSASVKKCDDFSSAANCRPFLNNIANTDVCTLLSIPNTVYAKYLDMMVPRPKCPFKKGTYVLKDQRVEDEMARFLPGAGNTYWEVRSSGKVGDRTVLCFILQLNARPKRKES
ncbi:AAEL000117-PA [Aedes aegypti]|uniref:Uncharacterized protein n=2 Tax=Aedes aegypti TaxID=7159 RepID=Q17Q75_AEDAE|nr:uncharacterized protein LOC5567756 [Aedes aegypti]XP_021697616.1 uncharacterized protein LOC5567756 [Aedes aegypti]EAT48841.1 AAEL000117-PA [Aedes aegypti]